MNRHPTAEDLISLQDAAQSSGLSQGHLAHLIRSGDLWGIKIGRNWVTTEIAVSDYLASNPRPGPKQKVRKLDMDSEN
jgi:hypothetical protein